MVVVVVVVRVSNPNPNPNPNLPVLEEAVERHVGLPDEVVSGEAVPVVHAHP